MQTTEIQPAGRRAQNVVATRNVNRGADEQQQYLTFVLGEEMFAIGILSIREIIEYGFVTDVPMTPPFIRGVLNLRGAVVPVVDLAVRFGRQTRENSKRTCIVIVDIEADNGSQQQMGVVVDAVNEVLEIADGDIEPPPEFGARIRNDFIKSMGKIDGKFVVILDLNRVLSVEEVAVIASVTKSATVVAGV
ncbi:MAG: chemotaxis protein CheW [Proteobacteria bacterium]|nr:chemotaxis protein CheW [Pseudomonadota bacterium]